jgi:hypothetical protein
MSLKYGLLQKAALTLFQKFGSALNLNIYFYKLYLDGGYDGVYLEGICGKTHFYQIKASTKSKLNSLT